MISSDAIGPRSRIMDKATDLLREAILTGELLPGEPLVQQALAERLRVSRTPLREALRKLEQEGLVTLNARGQAVVRSLDRDYVLELYTLREPVDGLAARLCAERMAREGGGEWLPELEAVLAGMHHAVDAWRPEEWSSYNVRFHVSLVNASQNRPLQGLTSLLRMSAEMFYPSVLLHPPRAGKALAEHRVILDAVRGGTPEYAEAEARRHIRNAIALLRGS